MRCSNSSQENPSEARFCMACAAPLAAPSTEAPREIRKTVTVVFTDVTGSTSLGERLDPESMRRVMARYFEEMRRVLVRHGGTTSGGDSPMIGRERQLSMLVQAFQAAVADRACHLFSVLGSAGVGKSRLIQEFLGGVAADGQALRGRCLSYGEGITFWPVVEMVKTAAGVTDELAAGEVRARLASVLGDDPDRTAVAERLAELLGVGESPASPAETFWAVRRLFETLARGRPLVAVFDDIHWAEPTLLDLIEHLADWTKDAPVVLVCSARPELVENRPGWGGGKFNATSILLEPLGTEECARLIDNLLGATQLPSEVKRRIVEAAEGTPLFVEEMLSMLIDDGLLRRDDGHWVPDGDLSKAEVPPTIHALLAARLDRLRLEERSVIECGSVEGKIFHRGALAELSPEPARAELEAHLMTLTRRELIRPDRSELAGEEAYRFRHQLIRDTAYEAISKERRAELHRRFADWLERAAGPMIQEYEEILGYHLEQAYRYRAQLGRTGKEDEDSARRAAGLLGGAGRRAFVRGDVPAAANLLQRALDLAPRGDPDRSEFSLWLGNALFHLAEYRRCEEVLTAAMAEASDRGDPGRAMLYRVELALARQQWNPEGFVEEAVQVSEAAQALFEEIEDDFGLARSWLLVGSRLNMLGHAEGIDQAMERAVDHARRAGDRLAERDALVRLASALYWGTVPAKQGSERLEQTLNETRGDRLLQARIQRPLAGFRGMQGRFDEARRLLDEAQAIFEELGIRLPMATGSFMSGPIELWAGRPEAAGAVLRRSCDALEAMGDRSSFCSLAAFLAEALYVQGKDEEAWHYTEVADRTAGAEDLEAQSDWRSVRAKLLARRGDLAQAEALAREAVEIIERTGENDHKGDAYMDLAEVLRMADRPDEEADALRRALGWYEAKGNLVMAGNAQALLTELER
jgi:tetratricopeptide (TPR) repeat protein